MSIPDFPAEGAGWRKLLLAMALATATATAACAHTGEPGTTYEQTTESTQMSQRTQTVIESEGVRVEVQFEAAVNSPLQVRYSVHNTGASDLAVFDRGDRHAVLTRRQNEGEVGQPGTRDEGDGDITVSHVAIPLPQPSPTLPPVPLAAKLAAGATLEGAFSYSPFSLDPPKRLRWCLGVAAFNEADFSSPEQFDGVEVWQAGFQVAERQQQLCTPWFDLAEGGFVD